MGDLFGGIETMLRMYPMQTWFNLSDEGTEDAIYDSYAMRSFLWHKFYDGTGSGCDNLAEVPKQEDVIKR